MPEQQAALGPSDKNAFLPFLTGPRSCIGQRLAVLELQTVLAVLLKDVLVSPSDKEIEIIQASPWRSCALPSLSSQCTYLCDM